MAEVRVIARVVAREGKTNELEALLRKLIVPTRAEVGCIFYELFQSNIPGLFYFNELWESQAHLNAHSASRHCIEILGEAKALLQEPLEVNLLKSVE
ncbi:MAG: putative quinol monooxygenase [Gammaproteobacteria bacterium]|nr:putative quinol monooxygenase [Gammaproteobacteria bacterium]